MSPKHAKLKHGDEAIEQHDGMIALFMVGVAVGLGLGFAIPPIIDAAIALAR